MSNSEKQKRVEGIISRLHLDKCADTKVGGNLVRGLSGGERKRTSIGYEIITNPPLMFLDEPTSGLDSFTALSLLTTLKELASEGRTIVCTIHQPSSEIFAIFDKLLLLVRGQPAYFGEASKSVEFFGNLGHNCPTYTNPSDYYMGLLQTNNEDDNKRVQTIVEAAASTLPPVCFLSFFLSFFLSIFLAFFLKTNLSIISSSTTHPFFSFSLFFF